jgi:hypothetical protein
MYHSTNSFGNRRGSGIGFLALGMALALGASAQALECPGRCIGGDNHGERCFGQGTSPDCPGLGAICEVPTRCVYLEFRPPQVVVSPNGVAEIQVWGYSSDGFSVPVQGVDLILDWDPTRIQLLGKRDPCLTCLGGSQNGNFCQTNADCPGGQCRAPDACFEDCPAQTYNWFASHFPEDCDIDGLNAPCPGFPSNDGDAFYQALSQIFCGADPAPPAFAGPLGDGTGGLLITTLRFQPLIPEGGALLHMPLSAGESTKTRVVGGDTPGEEVTGLLGPDAQIIVSDVCDPPTARALGSRYIGVTPAPGTDPVAIRITGNPSDSSVSCVLQYARPSCFLGSNNSNACTTDADCPSGTCQNWNGLLGDTPVYLTPAQWNGEVKVRGYDIQPNKSYRVRADCGGGLLSDHVTVTTWIWGDALGNGQRSFADISATVDAFRGVFSEFITTEGTDIFGANCIPQRLVNFQDVSGVVDAFRGVPFECAPPCP